MIKEILAKGQAKVKWGQIFNNVRLRRIKHKIVRLDVYMQKIYDFSKLFGHPVLK